MPVSGVSFLLIPGRKKISCLENFAYKSTALHTLLWLKERNSWGGGRSKVEERICGDYGILPLSLLEAPENRPFLLCNTSSINFPSLRETPSFEPDEC